MIEPMHLYPEEKKRMQEVEKQGLSVMTCNNWLCPFNNDGYCVEPTKGDICGIYGDEDFNKYLDVVYDENYSDDFRDSVRRVMIARWGKKEQRLIDADALKKENERLLHCDFPYLSETTLEELIDEAPTIDAIPIEFIKKRIAELKKLNEYEFIANGGYTSPSDYEQWELERLIRDWREQND